MQIKDDDSELLVYSSRAFSVYKDFQEKEFTILVEGKDDVGFWNIIFEKITGLSFYAVPLGCKNEVKKKITDLKSGGLKNTILAMDMDYEFENIMLDKNIVYTKGYSIENTLVNDYSLCSVINAYINYEGSENISKDVCDWLCKLHSDMKNLILLDIVSCCEKKGESVIKDHYSCLIRNEKSIDICPEKRNLMLRKIKNISEDEIMSIKSRVVKKGHEINSFIKGHFLFSVSNNFAVNYVNSKKKGGKKINIASDNFLAMLMLEFKNSFGNNHPEFDFYKNQILNSDVAVKS